MVLNDEALANWESELKSMKLVSGLEHIISQNQNIKHE